MSVEFKKPQRIDYIYQCGRCGIETKFTIKLPDHLTRHTDMVSTGNGTSSRCGGKYRFIAAVPCP